MQNSYHHGDLRAAFLRRAAEIVATSGVGAVSLRAIAAEEGVSHTAPRHHFGSREGLLTALATEGFDLLARRLALTRERGGSALDAGLAYVHFALEHPGHFALMFDVGPIRRDDSELSAAQQRAFGELRASIDRLEDRASRGDMAAATIAGWAMMHGLVALHRGGALERSHVTDLIGELTLPELAARIGPMLGGSSVTATSTDVDIG